MRLDGDGPEGPAPQNYLVDGGFEGVAAAERGNAEVETCMSRVPAIVHEIFFCFFGGSNLGERSIGDGMCFPEMRAQPALPILDM